MDQHQLKLTPEMASFRLLVLSCIRDYIGKWRRAPSQREICETLGVGRERVRRALASLAREQLILRDRGEARGIRLPEERDAAVRCLQELGFIVLGPAGAADNPLRSLPALPTLSYRRRAVAMEADGGGTDGSGAGANARGSQPPGLGTAASRAGGRGAGATRPAAGDHAAV